MTCLKINGGVKEGGGTLSRKESDGTWSKRRGFDASYFIFKNFQGGCIGGIRIVETIYRNTKKKKMKRDTPKPSLKKQRQKK